jgi:hypothetical protein
MSLYIPEGQEGNVGGGIFSVGDRSLEAYQNVRSQRLGVPASQYPGTLGIACAAAYYQA